MSGFFVMRRVPTAGIRKLLLRSKNCHDCFQIGICSSASRLQKKSAFDDEEIIEFTKSKGFTSNLSISPSSERDIPKHQPKIILGSFLILALYCYFREPNDLDERLDKSLFESIPELEESHLISVINHEMQAGRDTSKLQRRVEELQLARLRKERGQS